MGKQEEIVSPFVKVQPKLLTRLQHSIGRDAGAGFHEEIARLESLVLANDPVLLLSGMYTYHLFHGPEVDLELTHSDPLLQFQLEWLQGYCLRFPLQSYGNQAHLDPRNLAAIGERLKRIPVSSVIERWQRFSREWEPNREGSADAAWAQEMARIGQLAVRNWAYADQMFNAEVQLCNRIDDWWIERNGYRLSSLPSLFRCLIQEVEARYNAQSRAKSSVFQSDRSAVALCRRWAQSILPGADDAAELERKYVGKEIGGRDLLLRFARYYEAAFPAIYTFTARELTLLSGGNLTEEQILTLLDAMSLCFGDLGNVPIEYFTLGNPVWNKPFIRLPDNHYFCPVPGMLLSHSMEIIESLVPRHGMSQWWDARSTFLECRTQGILENAFPSASIYANSKWKEEEDDETVYENDLAVVVGDALLIVEAKSHRVPSAVRRGAPDGMKESINQLIVAPTLQGSRFAKYALASREPRPFMNDAGDRYCIDSSSVQAIIQLNAILDPFIVASESTSRLRDSGLLAKDDPDPAPTMLFTDLESVLAILPGAIQKVHYLARRGIIQNHFRYSGSEIDWLAVYVKSGFTSPELENIDEEYPLRGIGKALDRSLERHYAQLKVRDWPTRELHSYWRQLIRWLEREKPRACYALEGWGGVPSAAWTPHPAPPIPRTLPMMNGPSWPPT